jgi:predicted acylesterase/phospholipase RssA
MNRFFIAVLAVGLAASRLPAQEACAPARTALVLSGGGAKGLAHIGLLRALDSLGARPDFIVGTSMGSIVGALYATGLTGAEIDSVVRSSPGGTLIRSFRPIAPRSLGVLQPMVSFAADEGMAGFQTGAVAEREVDGLLTRLLLLGNLRAGGNFDSLPIPFRAVATDFRARVPVVLGTGDLALAVRASIAIPLIFPTVDVDGRTLVDGGLTANIPVEIARQLGATRVIVSDVSGPLPDSVPLASTGAVAQRLMDYVFEQPAAPLGPEDVYVRHDVGGFGGLDFSAEPARALLAIGRRTADSVLASATCLAPLAGDAPLRYRAVPRHVGRIVATDGHGDAAKVLRDLGFRPGDSIPWGEVWERMSRLAESEQIDGVWLYPSGSGDTVSFAPRLRHAPGLSAFGGFAYDNTLGGRVWLAGVSENLMQLGLGLSSRLALGGLRSELELGARKNLRYRWRVLAPTLLATAAEEKVPLYDAEGSDTGSIRVRELVGFAGLDRAYGHGWRMRVGIEGRTWDEPIGSNSAGGLLLRMERFDDWDAPRGFADVRWTDVYRFGLGELRWPFRFGERFGVRTLTRVGLGEALPPHLAFMLGGDDGFPGIRPAQLRGDREVSAQGQFWARIFGSLEATVELGVGRIATGGPLVNSDGWLSGVRVGARMNTPLGPLSAAHGWASDGNQSWFVRFFRWF